MISIDINTILSKLGLAAVTTGTGGSWHLAVRPRIQTTYRASATGAATELLTVGVEPRIASTPLRHDRLRVHVAAAAPLTRRLVQLQAQNADGSWTTIARRHLDRSSTSTLAPPSRPTLVASSYSATRSSPRAGPYSPRAASLVCSVRPSQGRGTATASSTPGRDGFADAATRWIARPDGGPPGPLDLDQLTRGALGRGSCLRSVCRRSSAG